MKLKINGLLTLFLALVVQIGFAQTKTVTGIVTDPDGLPLPGVNVIIEGQNTGTQTGFDGDYTIQATSSDKLTFSYVGFDKKTITVGNQTTIDVKLERGESLDEVVVVGYSTTTKQSFTGSAKKVDGELLNRKNVSNVSQALTGESAGVQVINNSGQPGSSAQVRIRGIGSVNGNTAPLYVVDGAIYNGSLNSINPQDIESTTILKDASATAVYGARGANGVILINTKGGSAKASSIEISTRTGYNVNLLPRYDVIESPEQYIALGWEGIKNLGQYGSQNLSEQEAINYANNQLFSSEQGIGQNYNMWNVADGSELIDPATGQVRSGVTRRYNPEDWEDYGFQTSTRTETNVRISGGDDKTTYFTSFGYLEDVGYIVDSDFERYSGRLNLTHQAKDWLTGSVNVGYTISETNNNGQSEDSGSIFWFVDNIPSIYPLYLRNEEGGIVQDPVYGGPQYDYGEDGRRFGALTNSIADAYYSGSKSERQELNTNSYLKADITNNLSAEMRMGTQYFNNSFNSLQNPFYGPSSGQGGSIFKQKTELFSTNFQQIIRYGNSWGDHNLDAFVAHESNSWERQTLFISKNNLIDPNGTELNNAVVVSSPPGSYVDNYTLESWFGNFNYNYKDTYYLSGTVRRDGSSRFLDDNKWGNFGSIGAAWIASNENFMDSVDFVDFLKLKSSYGLIGEQGGVGFYPGYTIYNIGNLNDNPSLSFNTRGNPDLTWETSKMLQFGLETTLFDNFIDVNIDYYRKVTDDLLFDRRVPPSTGIALITVNDGQLLNSGLEFDLNAHLIQTDDFFLDLTVNGAFMDMEFLEMPIDPATGEPKILDQNGIYGRAEGKSQFDYYTREYAGVDAADGRSMWYQYYDDINGNGTLDGTEGILSMTEYLNDNPDANIQRTATKEYGDATQKFIGKSAIPDVRGAFNLSTAYKGFTLGAQFLYQIGGYSYDSAYQTLMGNDPVGGNNWHTDILDRWQQPGDITNVPRLSNDLDPRVNATSDRFLVKSDYLALNNVRLGYNIPKQMLDKTGIQDLSIFLSGDNLFLLSERDGFNPSTSITGASNQYRYSPLSTFTVGVNLKF